MSLTRFASSYDRCSLLHRPCPVDANISDIGPDYVVRSHDLLPDRGGQPGDTGVMKMARTQFKWSILEKVTMAQFIIVEDVGGLGSLKVGTVSISTSIERRYATCVCKPRCMCWAP